MEPTVTRVHGPIKGYKAVLTDNDGHYYTNGNENGVPTRWDIGSTNTIGGEPKLCNNGFHFFKEYCFAVNYLKEDNVILEVEAQGVIIQDTFKLIATELTVLGVAKALTDTDRNSGDYNSGDYNSGDRNSGHCNNGNCNSGDYNSGNCNSGDYNSGYCNSGKCNSGGSNSGGSNSGDYNGGNYNSGDYNSGDYNSGDYNSGNYNSGDYNSGYCNSGDYNSGYCNSGDYNSGGYNSGCCNSGDCNSGDYNSGDCNSGDYNSGGYNSGCCNSSSNGYKNYFCTDSSLYLFDIQVAKIPRELERFLQNMPIWFSLENCDHHTAWSKCPKDQLDILRSIPEFQTPEAKEKFHQITGLTL